MRHSSEYQAVLKDCSGKRGTADVDELAQFHQEGVLGFGVFIHEWWFNLATKLVLSLSSSEELTILENQSYTSKSLFIDPHAKADKYGGMPHYPSVQETCQLACNSYMRLTGPGEEYVWVTKPNRVVMSL